MDYKFEKHTDSAYVTDNKISLDFCLNIKKMEDSYLVEIPSLKIFFYTKTDEEIEKEAQVSLENFFNHWVKEKGEKDFLNKMLNLGFTIKRKGIQRRPVRRRQAPSGKKRKLKEEFSI